MTKKISFVLAVLLLILSACSKTKNPRNEQKSGFDSTNTTKQNKLSESYANARYDISLQKPEEWILLEEPNLKPSGGTFAINIFKRGTNAEQEIPLHVHASAKHSYVAIWPHGIGTELPPSQYARLDTMSSTPDFNFKVNYEESKALLLKNGAVWAFFIVPEAPPQEWEKHGFIFAQIRSTNHSATCYDEKSGEKISLKKCDFLQGDRYVREADLDTADAHAIRQILESISLERVKEKTTAADLIEVEKPQPNMDVTSPLTIKGKARGSWYFEGSFSVELQDAAGNTLTQKAVQAQGKWMTEDFVPFEVTIKFDAPDDERGRLIFHRANPSGLKKNKMQYSLPIIFPPK